MSDEDKRAVNERALESMETDPADDGGVTELACAIMRHQLLPE
ncbi:hypothetical protein [Rhizobium sp. P32RR-XVIII]|nr:hypothetical protein [Rhizobium sp. P32RR-XVIII]